MAHDLPQLCSKHIRGIFNIKPWLPRKKYVMMPGVALAHTHTG
jgi:hypothetical protein